MKNSKLVLLVILMCYTSIMYAQETYSRHSLSLEQCKEMALKNNVKAKNANLLTKMAQQQKQEAFTKYFPSVNVLGLGLMSNKYMLSIDFDPSNIINSMLEPITSKIISFINPLLPCGIEIPSLEIQLEPQKIEMLKNGIVAGVMATQPVFAGGQIVNGNLLAKTAVEVRQLQKQMSENEVLLLTETYYWQLVALKVKIKTIENADSMLRNIMSDAQIAVKQGLTTRNDLLRVEIEQNKLESNKLKLIHGIRLIKMAMAQHIGLTNDDFDIDENDFDSIAFPMAQNQQSALKNRPEFQLLEKSVKIVKLQKKMETGKYMPSIAVGAAYNYMKFDEGMKNHFGVLLANVSIPITDWWGGTYAIKRKNFELQAAINTQQETTDLLLLQMQKISNELDEAYEQIMITKKSILASQENLKINEDTYNAGVTTLSVLLEAQNLLQQSQDQYTEAVTLYFIKLAEYSQVFDIQ